MAKHFLNVSQGAAGPEQGSRRSVSEIVEAEVTLDPRPLERSIETLSNRRLSNWTAAFVREHSILIGPSRA